jgi:hypothetical protein
MATDKMFTVVGISRHPDHGYKIRFANDIMRIKNLSKGGHTDIRLVELDSAMTKMEAVVSIRGMDEFADATAQSCIMDYVERNTARVPAVSTPTATKKAAAPKAKAKKAAELEDESAPF